MGWADPGAAFTAIIQIGTLAAVLIYFAKDIVSISGAVISGLLKGKPLETDEARTGWMIAVGTIPIVVFGLLFKHEIETVLRSLYIVSASMIGLAIVLLIAEKHTANRNRQGRRGKSINELTWTDAIIIGLAQAMALIPGSSRSGVTITGGLFRNLDRETAARFSFLLSLPSVFAAGILELYQTRHEIMSSTDNILNLVVATIAAFISPLAPKSLALVLKLSVNSLSSKVILCLPAISPIINMFLTLFSAAGLISCLNLFRSTPDFSISVPDLAIRCLIFSMYAFISYSTKLSGSSKSTASEIFLRSLDFNSLSILLSSRAIKSSRTLF
jgi:undecaprenyl-diphosphatase